MLLLESDNVLTKPFRSTTHPDFPDSGSHVRVHDYFSDMVIKSHSTIDEFGINFELTYFDNPQTQLPSSCVNWVASSGKYVVIKILLTRSHSTSKMTRTTKFLKNQCITLESIKYNLLLYIYIVSM